MPNVPFKSKSKIFNLQDYISSSNFYTFLIRVDDSDLMDEMTTKMAANNIKKNSFKSTNSSIDKSVNI